MKKGFLIAYYLYLLKSNSQKVYDFEFKDINNSTKSYDELKGDKLTLIDFVHGANHVKKQYQN